MQLLSGSQLEIACSVSIKGSAGSRMLELLWLCPLLREI